MNPRRIKGARGTRWRKGSLSHTWSQLVQLMPTGTSRRYRADHSPTRVCAHTPVLATISVPRTRTLTKQKAAGPTGPAAFSFSKCQRHCRSEAVHLMFAARQRSPEGLGDLPQVPTAFETVEYLWERASPRRGRYRRYITPGQPPARRTRSGSAAPAHPGPSTGASPPP